MTLIFKKAAAFTCCMCSGLVLSMRTKTSPKLSYFVTPYNFDCRCGSATFRNISKITFLGKLSIAVFTQPLIIKADHRSFLPVVFIEIEQFTIK